MRAPVSPLASPLPVADYDGMHARYTVAGVDPSRYYGPNAIPRPVGLGRFEYRDWTAADGTEHRRWYYVSPDGTRTTISHWSAEPPPLPKANPHGCGCHEGPHRCSSCGQPYYVEIHGMADGFCTYCYNR